MEWFSYRYEYPYPHWGNCGWFPWLSQGWWTGLYGPTTPYAAIPKEHEITMLENHKKQMEEALNQIKKRLEELKKGGVIP